MKAKSHPSSLDYCSRHLATPWLRSAPQQLQQIFLQADPSAAPWGVSQGFTRPLQGVLSDWPPGFTSLQAAMASANFTCTSFLSCFLLQVIPPRRVAIVKVQNIQKAEVSSNWSCEAILACDLLASLDSRPSEAQRVAPGSSCPSPAPEGPIS